MHKSYDCAVDQRPCTVNLTSFQHFLTSLFCNLSVVGFFVGDELVSGKRITWTDISTALAMLGPLKQRHDQLFVWQNEGGTGWETHLPGGKLPPEVCILYNMKHLFVFQCVSTATGLVWLVKFESRNCRLLVFVHIHTHAHNPQTLSCAFTHERHPYTPVPAGCHIDR